MAQMNYLHLINGFWAKSESDNITAIDIAVYFAILKYCNGLNWLNPFICHWDIVCQYSKCSKNAFYKSVNRLSEKGYIQYTKGQRNSLQPKILVLQLENRKGTVKEQQGNNEGTAEEHGGNLYKPLNDETIKLNKRKIEFKNSLTPFLGEYNTTLLNDFYQYWTEKSPKGKKMRFELEKVFEPRRRLSTWFKREKKYKEKNVPAQKESRASIAVKSINKIVGTFNYED